MESLWVIWPNWVYAEHVHAHKKKCIKARLYPALFPNQKLEGQRKIGPFLKTKPFAWKLSNNKQNEIDGTKKKKEDIFLCVLPLLSRTTKWH